MRRLAVMAPDATKDDDTIFTLDLPPTAIKGWDKYVSNLADKGRVPRQVITKFTMDSTVNYSKPIPTLVDNNDNFTAHHERLGEARTLLHQGYDYSSTQSAPPRRTSSRVRRTAKKKR